MIELVRANELREAIHLRVRNYAGGEGDPTACGPLGVAITVVPRPLPK
jgi:hypothetical protein